MLLLQENVVLVETRGQAVAQVVAPERVVERVFAEALELSR